MSAPTWMTDGASEVRRAQIERDWKQRGRMIAAAFRPKPVFRQGFDQHVRKWNKHVQRTVWVNYHTDPDFKRAYDDVCRREQEAK